MERTLVILKPDAVERKLIGEIITRFEKRNFKVVHIKMMTISCETADIHYSHVKSESIYDDMINFITSGPSVCLVLEGYRVIQAVRNMIGKTSTIDSPSGTIRGDYGADRFRNLVHASDSEESFITEFNRFFPEISY